MIISHIWLRARWTDDYPDEAFEVLVTNLEPVALRFRFRFVATQMSTAFDNSPSLREHFEPVTNFQGPATLLAMKAWTRSGHLHSTHWEFVIGPGETQHTGLAASKAMNTSGMFSPDVLRPDGTLRGHWELSLPVTAPAPPGMPKAQIDHPARVLVAAFRRSFRNKDGHVTHDAALPMPLAGGDAERLIPPDAPARTTISGKIGVLGKRKAAKRRTRRR